MRNNIIIGALIVGVIGIAYWAQRREAVAPEIVPPAPIEGTKTDKTDTDKNEKSGVAGRVTLSPVCPVERIPPDPNCAPRPYQTSIKVMKAGSTQTIKTIQSDSDGRFIANLDPGSYTLQAQGGQVLPRCPEVSVVVKSGQYAAANIDCDTGIR